MTDGDVGDGDERFGGRGSHDDGHDPGHLLDDVEHEARVVQHRHERGEEDDDRQNTEGEDEGIL